MISPVPGVQATSPQTPGTAGRQAPDDAPLASFPDLLAVFCPMIAEIRPHMAWVSK